MRNSWQRGSDSFIVTLTISALTPTLFLDLANSCRSANVNVASPSIFVSEPLFHRIHKICSAKSHKPPLRNRHR